MDENALQVRRLLEARLITRAMEDPAFHDLLAANPRAAFEEEMGVPMPAALKLQVLEVPDDTLVLALPPKPGPAGELSDAELDAVSGGSLWLDLKEFLGIPRAPRPEGVAVAGVRG